MKKKYVLLFLGFLLLLNIAVWQEVFALSKDKPLKVDFLDVGQGDSVFIETPQGHQIIIDGGPNSTLLQKLSERMPFWDKSIDLVILTHPEKDHMTGLLDVLQNYKVDYFLWIGVIKNDAENKKLAELLNKAENAKPDFLASLSAQSATKVIAVSAGEKIKSGEVLIDILYPPESLAGKELKNTSNDSGVVLKLIFGKNAFIFTGDISASAERKIVNRGENVLADVLKVAHHGSKYSTTEEFLSAVMPEIAVISVGKNSYGHPTPETLQKLEKYSIKTLRTDQKGDITILSNGNNLIIN